MFKDYNQVINIRYLHILYFRNETNNKPEIVIGQYNSRAGISSLKKSRTRLYFLMSVASEARIENSFSFD
jgi:hypothetical protein